MQTRPEHSRLRWLAGPSGGGWFDLAREISEKLDQQHGPGLTIDVIPGGGFDNPLAVDRGRADIAMTVDFLAHAAIAGSPPYEHPTTNIAILVDGLSALPFHLLRRTPAAVMLDTAIRQPGFRVAIPERHTADELTFRFAMDFYGESYASIAEKDGLVIHGDYTDITDAFCGGQVDYLFGATTSPANVIRSIAMRSREARLDSLPDDLMHHLVKSHRYLPMRIPAGTYPWSVSHDAATVGFGTVLIKAKDSDNPFLEAVVQSIRRHLGIPLAGIADHDTGAPQPDLAASSAD